MKVYLVGGAVRDELLGIPVIDRDWCVVGSTPEEMLAARYKPVGKDFPVFLHPETGEEYALARTERKTGRGYHGFSFNTSPDISIEDDLARRDLTINAIAKAEDGSLIDPFAGAKDIEQRKLRHVSDAFSEDPVRILRAARFAARFKRLGFEVADETLQLMQSMIEAGEADALAPERVWKETQNALGEPHPAVYFSVLRECGALARVYPEIDALFGVPQPAKWHPEIDCGIHTLMALEQASKLTRETDVRFAALVHDLGKATTDKDVLPSHPGHEKRGTHLIRQFAERLPVPKAFRELALNVAEFHTHCHRVAELKATTLLRTLENLDAFRRPERFEKFLLVCEADARGRTGLEDRAYPQADYMRNAFKAVSEIELSDLTDGSMTGPAIGKAIYQRRLSALKQYIKSARDNA